MRMRNFAAGAAMLAAGLMPAMGSAAAEAQDANYIGVIGDMTQQCGVGVGIGGACFSLSDGTSGVTISIADMVNGDDVGFRVDFRDASNVRIGSLLHACGSISAPIPAGAESVRVGVDGPLNGPSACNTSLPGGVGVAGTITLLEG